MQKPENSKSADLGGGAARPSKQVCILTFGCQMNEADSENIAAAFRRRGRR